MVMATKSAAVAGSDQAEQTSQERGGDNASQRRARAARPGRPSGSG
ncbi:TetR family transcriptional regulator, partial [Paraburkholderia steynii]